MGDAHLLVAVYFKAVHLDQPVLIIGTAGRISRVLQAVMLLILYMRDIAGTASARLLQEEYRLLHEAGMRIHIQFHIWPAHGVAILLHHNRVEPFDVARFLVIQQAICAYFLVGFGQNGVAGCFYLILLVARQVISFQKNGHFLRDGSLVILQRARLFSHGRMGKSTKQSERNRLETKPHNIVMVLNFCKFTIKPSPKAHYATSTTTQSVAAKPISRRNIQPDARFQ